jgi:hypothetical protein
MAAVAGLRGTGDWATDERPKNFREMILFRNPNGTAPLFALMGKMADEAVNDPEFAWWDEPNDLLRLQVNGALTNVATAFVVDSADPSSATPTNFWGVAKHLKPGDLLLVENAALDVGFTNEIVMVATVTSDTAFSVTRGVAGTTAAAIADDAFLLKIGSAYAEGSNAPDATSRNPIKFFNYTQIFKNAYELTRTAGKTKTRTGDPKSNDKKRKIWDHSRDIELSLMFGQRFETTGSNGKPLRFTGGLREFIPAGNVTVFGATTTLTQYLNASYKVFDFDTPAGNERILFCGNNYLNNLNLLVRLNSQVQFNGTVSAYGLKLKEFSLPQGTFYLKTHPLMNRHPQFFSSAFIIDASALRWRYITDTMFEDNIQTPGQDSQKGQWLTEGGLEVRYAGLTLGYHGNFIGVA